MASASPSPIEHLKTLLTEEVLNTVQSYFEIKIVHEEGGTLYLFLHDRVHELFHYYVKTQCCWVPTNPCSKVQIKGKLKQEQFDILFENDPLVQPTHETKDIKGRILQHCICPLAPRQSKDLDVTDLDFTLINCLIKTCRKTPAGHPQWLQDILEVRNELSHLGDTNDITADRVEAWWVKLENAAINIAGTIGAAHKKGLERRISKIKTSQSQLEELMEALKSRDDQLEQKILSAIKNMGINIDGVHFRITTAKDEPNTCPDIAVPTSCTDPRKCIVGWKFYGPADWSISEMQKKLECIGIIGDFNIQFVHQGCLMVHTTIDRLVLSDADVFREAVEEFLLLFTKRLKIPVTREGHPLDVVLSIRDHNAHNTTYEKTEELKTELESTREQITETGKKVETLSTEKTNADALRKKTIDEWRKRNENYVSTSATTFVSETLKSSRGVIVTGPPGCGKSAVAHHVALVLEGQGYELYPIKHPSEVMKVFCKDKKQVLVIDDICGKFVFEQLLSKAWEHEEQNIKKLLNEETVDDLYTDNAEQDPFSQLASSLNQTKLSGLRIIATCRENIYINTAFPDFNCFNLKQCSFSENYKLSEKELQEIALAYLEQTTLDKIQNVAEFDFFPLLCSLFQRRKDKDIQFFTHPVDAITAEIKGLKRDSHTAFIALALLVLHNNDLKRETLESKEIHEAIKDICKECDIEQALNKIPDCVTFTRLEGIFISESDDGYTAVHHKMFDILSIAIASSIMSTIIKHADSQFIRNRIQLKSHGQSIGNVIYIPEKQKALYMDRQKAEIIKGNYLGVFDNLNTRNEEYRKSLVEFIDNLFPLDVTSNSENATPLHMVASSGYIELVQYFSQKYDNQLDQTDADGNSPFMKACEEGHCNVVQFLYKYVHRFPNMITKSIQGYSSLHLAAKNGHNNVVKQLVEFGMNVNDTTRNNFSPLYLACLNGHYNTVEFLLHLKGNIRVDPRIKAKNGWTALHAACEKGHTNIVNLLINVGMDINETTNCNETPLLIASYNGQYETVKLLVDMNGDKLDSRVDTRIKDKNGWTALQVACWKGHTNIVKLLIDVGMYINETTNDNETPLYLASYNGQYEIVKFLLDMNGDKLDSRVDTRIKNSNGWTALHAACRNGHTIMVRLLIDVGMNINEATNDNETPLYLASYNGQYETVKLLVDMNGDKLDSRVDTRIKDEDGFTALHVACLKGQTNIVKLLIDVGMNINKTTNDNETPLYLASYNGQYETVKCLIEMNGDRLDSRVDTRIKDKNGWTALQVACWKGHTNIVKLLIDVGMYINETTNDNETPLYLASCNGQYEIGKLLVDMNGDKLDSRVDTRIKDKNGWTALQVACWKGHTNIVKLLIDVGMYINETTNDNETPLYLASYNGQYEIVKFLLDMNGDKLESRVDTRIKNSNGWTALHAACRNGHTIIVRLLIDVGMNINKATNDNETPLYIASYNGQYETVKFLLDMNGDKLDSRVDTRIKDEDGFTALHVACLKGQTNIVKLLIDVGMNINKTTNDNETPLYLASCNGQYETVKLLVDMNGDKLDSRVDTRIKDKNGWTALQVACWKGHTNIVKLLIDVGMYINETTNDNETPLYLASYNGQYETFKFLLDINRDKLDSRVDTRIKDKNEMTALHAACWMGHHKIVQLFLEKYSQSGHVIKQEERQKCIDLAQRKKDERIVDLLMNLK